ncbi:AzlC family ABC transporter permease [Bacillus ginsengihumi]|uniref:AzlC family ABC transporter permease n=1 Tax=Heyndrickxia ginsengihumi TaxID=363870 RepID=A0A6M0P2V8_9BACI|nr:AzlC family ABC transporter permease [Bacillus sp. (in: firmicutes)]NEY18773.1 AzlC family ABC transporter permease [Heyndrickxia ginsengihumi]
MLNEKGGITVISDEVLIDAKESDPTFSQGVKDCVPTLIGYISIGIAFGIVGVTAKLSVMEIALLSIFVYAGASQFIICALLAANSPIFAIILTTFIVNLRNFLLSVTLAPHFTKYSLVKNISIGALVTDESFGVAMNKIIKGEQINDRWMNGLNITAYISWVLSSIVGAIFGKWISNPQVFGLDFALTAMFAALLVLQLQSIQSAKLKLYLSLIVYMIIAMIILSVFIPSNLAVIIATIVVATIGVVKDK